MPLIELIKCVKLIINIVLYNLLLVYGIIVAIVGIDKPANQLE